MRKNFMKLVTIAGMAGILLIGCGNQNNGVKGTTSAALQPVPSTAIATEPSAQAGTTTSNIQQETTPSAQNVGSTTTPASGEITEEEAKTIAFQHAQIVSEEVSACRVKKDIDDGIAVYDVEFCVQNKEYDYEIKAEDGAILSVDYEVEEAFGASNSTGTISEAEAKQIVLAKVVGATEQNIRIQLDTDDGVQVYEGELIYNNIKYEFELNAQTGEIIQWEQEN